MNAFNFIAGIATLLGFGYAIFESYQRRKVEQFARAMLKSLPGNIAKAQQSTEWAYNNIRRIRERVANLPESQEKKELIGFTSDAQGDASAADRLLVNLFNETLTFQEAQFGTRDINHPQKNDLALIKKKVEQSKKNNP